MPARICQFGRTSVFVALSFLMLLGVGVPGAFAAPAFIPGYKVVQAPLALQPQWQRLLTSSALQPGKAEVLWQDLHEDLADKHPLRQLDGVNKYFNRIRYGDDTAIYGVRDYWASPAEFIQRNFGDCEDYSIAKYVALRALGWSADSLLIVVVRDRKYSLDHAVLAAKLDGQWHLLDNRSPRVLSPAEVPFYQPTYAVNENQLLLFERTWLTREASVSEKLGRAGKSSAG